MTRFDSARQPALAVQEAAMLPAQTTAAGASGGANLFMPRSDDAFVPVSALVTTRETTARAAAMTTTERTGAPRNLLVARADDAAFLSLNERPGIVIQTPGAVVGGQYVASQFGSPVLPCQYSQGSLAGKAIFGACGVSLPGIGGGCGCSCCRILLDEVEIDDDGENGIDDDGSSSMPLSTKTPGQTAGATAPATTTPANAQADAAARAALAQQIALSQQQAALIAQQQQALMAQQQANALLARQAAQQNAAATDETAAAPAATPDPAPAGEDTTPAAPPLPGDIQYVTYDQPE